RPSNLTDLLTVWVSRTSTSSPDTTEARATRWPFMTLQKQSSSAPTPAERWRRHGLEAAAASVHADPGQPAPSGIGISVCRRARRLLDRRAKPPATSPGSRVAIALDC